MKVFGGIDKISIAVRLLVIAILFTSADKFKSIMAVLIWRLSVSGIAGKNGMKSKIVGFIPSFIICDFIHL